MHQGGDGSSGYFSSPNGKSRARLLGWSWTFEIDKRSSSAYALQHHRPLTLQATINPPNPGDHPTDLFMHHAPTFLRQINLFRGFDEVLVPLWMKTKRECSDSYLATLEKQLQEVLPAYLNDAQAQLSEMQVNQQWLKHKAWELSMANGNGNNSGLPYVDTINELLPMVSQFPGNLGLHGLSLFEHLLSVTYALTEILASQPAPRTPFGPRPHDQLCKILNIITVLRSGDHRFLPLLLSKVQTALPKLASPMLQNAPENTACNIDIFDGFGNAGMAQYPANEFENKFAIPRLDEMSSDSNSPGGAPPSSNDMNSPFVSSPAIMSPGIEMPHGLQTDFTSMPEMVMSPISHAPPPSSLGATGGLNTQPPQHAQHTPLSSFPSSNPQVQTLNANNVNPPPNISLASQMHLNQGLAAGIGTSLSQAVGSNNLLARAPPPQRSNSFALGLPHLRTVGDFQALQRASSDMSTLGTLGISPMGPDLDFNTIPR